MVCSGASRSAEWTSEMGERTKRFQGQIGGCRGLEAQDLSRTIDVCLLGLSTRTQKGPRPTKKKYKKTRKPEDATVRKWLV